MLMGYTQKDVRKMMITINAVAKELDESGAKDNLEMAYDFFEGLLMEGRV